MQCEKNDALQPSPAETSITRTRSKGLKSCFISFDSPYSAQPRAEDADQRGDARVGLYQHPRTRGDDFVVLSVGIPVSLFFVSV